ncbi:transcriptional enhancer factor TEF-3-like [Galendromus occidentalis]|uniref:Transcriptional enhancer factor TEF-3-like n=1 Tax=Galendromus occidentalis TaxID=34638 RepID=A0AAJ6QR09_9ACAR|nr:transcriptional enhancer factor TEF-3-like [Galendromus occidentalis]
MYGHNELIALHIFLSTGKTRTRKQVSSHIQVLARRERRRANNSRIETPGASTASSSPIPLEGAGPAPPMQAGARVPPSVPADARVPPPIPTGTEQVAGVYVDEVAKASSAPQYQSSVDCSRPSQSAAAASRIPSRWEVQSQDTEVPLTGDFFTIVPCPWSMEEWKSMRVENEDLRLIRFSACAMYPPGLSREGDQQRGFTLAYAGDTHCPASPVGAVTIRGLSARFPRVRGGLEHLFFDGPAEAFFFVRCWVDLDSGALLDDRLVYLTNSDFDSASSRTVVCATRLFARGQQVVENVAPMFPQFDARSGRYTYGLQSMMGEYALSVVEVLKESHDFTAANTALRSHTMLQVVSDMGTGKTLLCIAYIFEVTPVPNACPHQIYRLVDC